MAAPVVVRAVHTLTTSSTNTILHYICVLGKLTVNQSLKQNVYGCISTDLTLLFSPIFCTRIKFNKLYVYLLTYLLIVCMFAIVFVYIKCTSVVDKLYKRGYS